MTFCCLLGNGRHLKQWSKRVRSHPERSHHFLLSEKRWKTLLQLEPPCPAEHPEGHCHPSHPPSTSAALRHVTPHHATSRHTMSCHATSCHVTLLQAQHQAARRTAGARSKISVWVEKCWLTLMFEGSFLKASRLRRTAQKQ